MKISRGSVGANPVFPFPSIFDSASPQARRHLWKYLNNVDPPLLTHSQMQHREVPRPTREPSTIPSLESKHGTVPRQKPSRFSLLKAAKTSPGRALGAGTPWK